MRQGARAGVRARRARRGRPRGRPAPRALRPAPAGLLQVGEVDLVTAVDREAEGLIVETALRRLSPTTDRRRGVARHPGRGDHRWYVDPLDGTTNFAHGFPQFAVSIALARGGSVVLGVVHDPAARGDLRGRAWRRRAAERAPRSASPTSAPSGGASSAPASPTTCGSASTSTWRSGARRSRARAGRAAGRARRRSTSATSPVGASTPSGSGSSAPGTWRRAA